MVESASCKYGVEAEPMYEPNGNRRRTFWRTNTWRFVVGLATSDGSTSGTVTLSPAFLKSRLRKGCVSPVRARRGAPVQGSPPSIAITHKRIPGLGPFTIANRRGLFHGRQAAHFGFQTVLSNFGKSYFA